MPHPTRLNLPPALRPGGTLGVVAPSSPVDREAFERGVAVVRQAGYEVTAGDHVFDRDGGTSPAAMRTGRPTST